jgi:hypothetical protein
MYNVPHGRVAHLRQDPTKTTTLHRSIALTQTVIENCSTLFYLESIAASFLHVRKLCPASLQRPQRLYDGWPTLKRALFFAFLPSLHALNSFRVVS